jgi:hypothetical protein
MPDSERVPYRGGNKHAQSVAGLAAKQFGVVSLDQLLASGLTRKQVYRLVERGFFHRLFRGVFAVGHPNIGSWGWLMAASLACGPDAFLSHRTAAAAFGLRDISTYRIEVTIHAGRAQSRDRLIIHRTSWATHPEEITTRNKIRISSVPRLFIELSPKEKPAELERLITLSARKRILDVDAVERAIVRHSRRPGIAILKAAFARYRPGPDRRSELERLWDLALERTPDIPQPLKNVTLDGWELDNYWPQFGLDVELDGRPYHIAVRDIEKDKLRDAKLLRRGIQTLRFTDFRIEYDIADCLDDVRAVIRVSPPPPPAGS